MSETILKLGTPLPFKGGKTWQGKFTTGKSYIVYGIYLNAIGVLDDDKYVVGFSINESHPDYIGNFFTLKQDSSGEGKEDSAEQKEEKEQLWEEVETIFDKHTKPCYGNDYVNVQGAISELSKHFTLSRNKS